MKVRLIWLIVAAAGVLLVGCGRSASGVSLKFVRYGTNYLDGRIAYLRLTNASNKAYVCPTMDNGGAYTMRGPVIRVSCAFKDLTQSGWTNWSQESLGQSNAVAIIAPHSELEVVVPTPANVKRRKVAALCREANDLPISLKFWTSQAGFRLLHYLPRSLVKRILTAPPLIRIWCERELSFQDDNQPSPHRP